MTDYLRRPIDLTDPAVVSIFDELSYWSAHFGALLLQHIELKRGVRGLDVGSGLGFPLFELAHMHGASCQFVGLDVWQPALDRAELKRRIYGLDNVQLLHYDGAHFPFPDAHFDLIVSNLGINNFENPSVVLSECARVAQPQARLILTTNVKGHMHEFYDVYRATLTELGMPSCLERLAKNEDHRGTCESVCGLVEAAGFQVSKVVEDHFTLRFLDGSTLLRHFFIRLGFLDGWRAVVNPDDEPRVFATLEQRLNILANQHGGLTMTIPMLYVESRRS